MVALLLGVSRLLAGLLLTVAAYGRLGQDVGQQIRDVEGYRTVGGPRARAVALVLPALETCLGGCLVLGASLGVVDYVAAAFLLVLALAAASALVRGLTSDCGCCGRLARRRVGAPVVCRNVVLVALLVADGLLGAGRRLVLGEGYEMGWVLLAVAASLVLLWQVDMFRRASRATPAPGPGSAGPLPPGLRPPA